MMAEQDVLALVHMAAKAAADKLGSDIVILDVTDLTSYTTYLLLISGNSERQVAAIASNIEDELKDRRKKPLGKEGDVRSSWALLDYGDFIAHVFTPEDREKYDLEGFWQEAPRLPLPEGVMIEDSNYTPYHSQNSHKQRLE